VEFVIPAGQGGGADQMARMIQGIITKNNLMKQSIIPVNKSAGAGAEGFLAVKEAKGDPHKIIITLSNLFTTPLATGVPFNWKEMTPVAMLALDQFILWTNTDKPYKNAKEFIQAAKTAGPGKFKMGGTGSKQEDQILTVGLEKATGTKFTYLPFKGGGDVAVQLVGNHIDSTVNNPIEAVAQWRAGKLKALCVFDDTRMPYKEKVTDTQSWNDIPTCSEAGVPTDYVMLRGIFMPPGVTQEQVNFYIDLFKKVRETADWKKFMADGAFNQTFMTGKEYVAWLEKNEALHKQLMSEAGFLAK
ncbi:MAG: tripartite tricarboxylate transporter substrate binding protein, partial [Polynucleobacter sp.]|nr:tripartite tricarboxylate transporter substrate binding protein [Polynucleobacter sp.]